MHEIELREIHFGNLDEVVNLEVRPEQKGFVADNAYSIAQALLDAPGRCRAAYLGNQPVGFVYTRLLEEGRLLYICRYMVDHHFQGRGMGRAMLMEVLRTAFLSGTLEMVDLAVSREPGNAEGFYARCGFTPTGEPYKGGWRMMLTRERYLEIMKETESGHQARCR